MDLAASKLLEGNQRLKIHASPYTYVRTIVMESALFSKHDYEKLLKMTLPEIIQFLEESSYKKEIDELAISEEGVQLVEHAVQRNFRRAIEKLRRISSDELRFLIDAYLWRNDVQNIKTLLRAKRSGEPNERVQNIVIPGTITKEELLALYNLPTVEDMLTRIDIPFMRNPASLYKEQGFTEFESALTKAYYDATLRIAQRMNGQGSALREFLLLEVDTTNIMTILKLKHEGASAEHIEQFIIEHGEREEHLVRSARERMIQRIIASNDVSDAFALLEKTRFREALAPAREAYEKNGSLLDAERRLRQYVLRRATLLTHQNPLSIDVVLGYLFAKTNEIRNIFLLIKGKQLGIDATVLEQEIVAR